MKKEKNKKAEEFDLDDYKPYQCGECHKQYKSYPAFYTHCKNAHQMQSQKKQQNKKKQDGPSFPKNSIIPDKIKSKKGRPSNNIKVEENKNLEKLISNEFLMKYCDKIQLRSMEFDCVDDLLIFLTELNGDYCIAKVGEERVDIKKIWEKEISKEITQLIPNLFATDISENSLDFIFQEFLNIISVDLKTEIIIELLTFFATLYQYISKIGGFKLNKLKEFPNVEWKRWKDQNKHLLSDFKIVGQQTYDLCNENVEFLVHFFIKYLHEASMPIF